MSDSSVCHLDQVMLATLGLVKLSKPFSSSRYALLLPLRASLQSPLQVNPRQLLLLLQTNPPCSYLINPQHLTTPTCILGSGASSRGLGCSSARSTSSMVALAGEGQVRPGQERRPVTLPSLRQPHTNKTRAFSALTLNISHIVSHLQKCLKFMLVDLGDTLCQMVRHLCSCPQASQHCLPSSIDACSHLGSWLTSLVHMLQLLFHQVLHYGSEAKISLMNNTLRAALPSLSHLLFSVLKGEESHLEGLDHSIPSLRQLPHTCVQYTGVGFPHVHMCLWSLHALCHGCQHTCRHSLFPHVIVQYSFLHATV
ncbi:hypothetical protein E2C01_021227 [Portunus trituberculatus]|uniref:Uncharacterized protein n=1 Tax=Portunus trituberculatus TaxID=210409 RepID=A0A5B7E3U2_PORTR|nr:hypothetical protein [Portunus trituberculatus]